MTSFQIDFEPSFYGNFTGGELFDKGKLTTSNYISPDKIKSDFTQSEETENFWFIPPRLSRFISDELRVKAEKNEYLRHVLIKSIEEIRNYLVKSKKKFELKADIWKDIEDSAWKEDVISVKISCRDNKEKREIWDIIDKIVRKYEKDEITLLTDVERLW